MFDFLASNFVMGLVGLIVFAYVVFAAETDRLVSGVLSFLAFLLAFDWLRDGSNIWGWALDNILTLLAYGVIYLAIGIVYTTFWKWHRYVMKNADPSKLDKFLEEYPNNTAEEYYRDRDEFELHPLNHVYRLTNWTLMWPFSLFWTLLHDPITWLWDRVYKMMGDIWLNVAMNADKGARTKK